MKRDKRHRAIANRTLTQQARDLIAGIHIDTGTITIEPPAAWAQAYSRSMPVTPIPCSASDGHPVARSVNLADPLPLVPVAGWPKLQFPRTHWSRRSGSAGGRSSRRLHPCGRPRRPRTGSACRNPHGGKQRTDSRPGPVDRMRAHHRLVRGRLEPQAAGAVRRRRRLAIVPGCSSARISPAEYRRRCCRWSMPLMVR